MCTRLPDRPWGRMWMVAQYGVRWWIKVINVRPGQRTSLQYHLHRHELHVGLSRLHWRYVPPKRWHRMGRGWYLEFAWGPYVAECDIVRVDDDFARHRTTGM